MKYILLLFLFFNFQAYSYNINMDCKLGPNEPECLDYNDFTVCIDSINMISEDRKDFMLIHETSISDNHRGRRGYKIPVTVYDIENYNAKFYKGMSYKEGMKFSIERVLGSKREYVGLLISNGQEEIEITCQRI